MSGADRRHAVGVARRTVGELAAPGRFELGASGRDVVAAALLHDVGKIEAGLGTWARAGVTFAAMATGRDQLVSWSGAADAQSADPAPVPGGRLAQRIGLYLRHDRVGAELLSEAGSDPSRSPGPASTTARPNGGAWTPDSAPPSSSPTTIDGRPSGP